MRSKRGKWLRVSRNHLLIIGVMGIVLYFGFLAEFNFYRLWRLQQRKAQLLEQVRISEARNKTLLERIEKLQNDDTVIEEEARQLFMAREGETIYLTPVGESE